MEIPEGVVLSFMRIILATIIPLGLQGMRFDEVYIVFDFFEQVGDGFLLGRVEG